MLCWRSLTKAELASERRGEAALRRRRAQESRATQARIRVLKSGEGVASASELSAAASAAPTLTLGDLPLRPIGGAEDTHYELMQVQAGESSAQDPELPQRHPVQLLLESKRRDRLVLQGAACQRGYAAAAAGGGGFEARWARRRALRAARTAAAVEASRAQEATELELAEAEARAAAAGENLMQYVYDDTRGLGDEAVTAVIGQGVHLWIASTVADDGEGSEEGTEADEDTGAGAAADARARRWEAQDVESRRVALEAKSEAAGGDAAESAAPAPTASKRLSAAAFKTHVASVREAQERARAKARARVEGRSRVITLEFDCTATRDMVLNALQMLIHVQQRETFQELEPIMGAGSGAKADPESRPETVRRDVYPFLVSTQGDDAETCDTVGCGVINLSPAGGGGRGRAVSMLPISRSVSAGARKRPLQRRRSSRLRERIHREGGELQANFETGRALPLNLADFRRHSWADSRTVAPESLPFSAARKEAARRVRIAGHTRPGSVNTMRRSSQADPDTVEQAELEVAAALSGYVEPDSPSLTGDDCEL